jgi:hypothetical protein
MHTSPIHRGRNLHLVDPGAPGRAQSADSEWQIDLFRVGPGEDPRQVRDARRRDAASRARAEGDRWIYRALTLVESVLPGCKIDDHLGRPDVAVDVDGHLKHVRVWQPGGPVVVDLHPGSVTVRCNPAHVEVSDGERFAALWRTWRVLAHGAQCAVFPLGDDDPTDMTMTEEQARAELHWA